MRALSSVNIFTEFDGGCFQLNPMAEYLCGDVLGSLKAMAIMFGEPWHLHA